MNKEGRIDSRADIICVSVSLSSLSCAVTSPHPVNSHFLAHSQLFDAESPACQPDSRSFVSSRV